MTILTNQPVVGFKVINNKPDYLVEGKGTYKAKSAVAILTHTYFGVSYALYGCIHHLIIEAIRHVSITLKLYSLRHGTFKMVVCLSFSFFQF